MELKVWSKTLLNIYGCLFKLSNVIDKMVLNYGLCSGRYYGLDKTFLDAEKMIALTDRKVTLINLKVLIEKSLLGLDDTSCKILTLKYVDRMSNEMIIKALEIKRRTFYRKFYSGISSFSKQLMFNGFNKKTFSKFIKSETWICDVYEEFMRKELAKQVEGDISNMSILTLAIKNFKNNNYRSFI